MAEDKLDFLGEKIMKLCRDPSIRVIQRMLSGEMKGRTAEAVRQELGSLDSAVLERLLRIVPAMVDHVLHNFLWMLEQTPEIDIIVSFDGDEMRASDQSDGLDGEPYGEEGWIARYSQFGRFPSRT